MSFGANVMKFTPPPPSKGGWGWARVLNVGWPPAFSPSLNIDKPEQGRETPICDANELKHCYSTCGSIAEGDSLLCSLN